MLKFTILILWNIIIYAYIYIYFKYFKSKFSKIEREYIWRIQRKLIKKSWFAKFRRKFADNRYIIYLILL